MVDSLTMAAEKEALGNGTIEKVLSQHEEALALDAAKQDKIDAIEAACSRRDVAQLRALADSKGGFLVDSARRLACECA